MTQRERVAKAIRLQHERYLVSRGHAPLELWEDLPHERQKKWLDLAAAAEREIAWQAAAPPLDTRCEPCRNGIHEGCRDRRACPCARADHGVALEVDEPSAAPSRETSGGIVRFCLDPSCQWAGRTHRRHA